MTELPSDTEATTEQAHPTYAQAGQAGTAPAGTYAAGSKLAADNCAALLAQGQHPRQAGAAPSAPTDRELLEAILAELQGIRAALERPLVQVVNPPPLSRWL